MKRNVLILVLFFQFIIFSVLIQFNRNFKSLNQEIEVKEEFFLGIFKANLFYKFLDLKSKNSTTPKAKVHYV